MYYTQQLDPLTGKYLTMFLVSNVTNTPDIRRKLLSSELSCCILKAAVIVDPFQVVVAANKAVLREKTGKLITKSVFTEILYAISSSTNISLSLTKFGIHDNDKNIIVAIVHERDDDGDALAKTISHHIIGEYIPMSRLNEFTDMKLTKKMYKIDDVELKVSSLTDSIVSRIGGDYLISLK